MVRCAPYLGPAMPRRGSHFFLFAQEKSNQKEGHPPHRPLRGFPALLAKPGGCATRRRSRGPNNQNTAREYSRASQICHLL